MTKLLLSSLAIVSLAACDGGGVGRVGSPAWQLSTSQEQKVAHFRQVCASYGFTENTPEMAQCIQQEAQGARASASERSAAIAASGAMMQPMTPPRQTTCQNFGGITRCTTY